MSVVSENADVEPAIVCTVCGDKIHGTNFVAGNCGLYCLACEQTAQRDGWSFDRLDPNFLADRRPTMTSTTLELHIPPPDPARICFRCHEPIRRDDLHSGVRDRRCYCGHCLFLRDDPSTRPAPPKSVIR